MTTEHHTQRVDFGENGHIEATRDDTDEIQDFRLRAFLSNDHQTREFACLLSKDDIPRETQSPVNKN